jgi:GT2 family glycosyltransferase
MSAVHEVGLMIEVAQVGGEETEWHRRFHDHGWKVIFFADASVIHYGSQTVSENSVDLYPEYLKGALYYFRLRRGAGAFALYCEALIAMYSTRLAWARLRRDEKGIDLAHQYLRVVREAMRVPRLPATRTL